MKRYRERWSLYLKPLDGLKYSILLLFHKTLKEVKVMHLKIRLMQIGDMLISFNVMPQILGT